MNNQNQPEYFELPLLQNIPGNYIFVIFAKLMLFLVCTGSIFMSGFNLFYDWKWHDQSVIIAKNRLGDSVIQHCPGWSVR